MPGLEIQGRTQLGNSGLDVLYVVVEGRSIPSVSLEIARSVNVDPDAIFIKGNVFLMPGPSNCQNKSINLGAQLLTGCILRR